ncbi:MAG TPA: sigma-70 family RNA polymerase sigma factor [Pirellulales bacterium]|nr:sigma-70 family RNA polymerase sigma factor [Pirellulales bacterium]
MSHSDRLSVFETASSRLPTSGDADAVQRLAEHWRAASNESVGLIWRAYAATFTRRLKKRFRPWLSSDECEEIVADSFAHAWEHRVEFHSTGSLEGWLWKITYHRAAAEAREPWCKQRARETPFAREKLFILTQRATAGPEENECPEIVRLAMSSLSDFQQRVLWADARSPAGRAPSDALARELGVCPSTVRSLRSRALASLKSALLALGYDGAGGGYLS